MPLLNKNKINARLVKLFVCVWLLALDAYGQNTVNVNGNVNGLWTSNNTYIVQSNIVVQQGDTLTIQPGTLIKVNPNCYINIYGTLIAIGTDTTKITFTSNKPNPAPYDWYGITDQVGSPSYQTPAPKNVILKNCVIEYCVQGVNIQTNKNLTVQNCEVRYIDIGIYFCGGNAFIEGNTVHDFYGGYYSGISIGIWSDVCTPNATISCNNIYNGDGYGMDLHSAAKVINNTISNITNSGQGGLGMKVDVYNNNEVSLNYINNCDIGIRMFTLDTIVPKIHNNVINNCNKYGIFISCYDYNGLPQGNYTSYKTSGIISNNIICNSGIGIYQYGSPCYGAPTINNNLLYNNNGGNFSNVALNSIGVKTTRNVNGDSCDVYQNIFAAPQFLNNQAPINSSTSPCINAGNVAYASYIGYDTDYVCLPPPKLQPDTSISIIVPNIFTPNNDGINDMWLCTASIPANLLAFQLNIYNRWGIKVFETDNITNPWNGNNIEGQICTDGTYYYMISYTDVNNKTNKLKGFIQLIR